MFKCNPNERISAKNALEHSYFKDAIEKLKPLYAKK